MKHKLTRLLFFFILFSIPLIHTAQKKNVIFTDVTKKAGIHFNLNYGDKSYKNIIESSGSGITVFDYNNDGLDGSVPYERNLSRRHI